MWPGLTLIVDLLDKISMFLFAFFSSWILAGILLWCIVANFPKVRFLFQLWSRHYAGGLTLANAGMCPYLTSVDPCSNHIYSQHIRKYSVGYPMTKSKIAARPSLSPCPLPTRSIFKLEFSTSTLPRFSSSARQLCTNTRPGLYKVHSKPRA